MSILETMEDVEHLESLNGDHAVASTIHQARQLIATMALLTWVERLNLLTREDAYRRLYIHAVKGRQDMRAAFRRERQNRKPADERGPALPLPPGFPFAREIREDICATLEERCEAPLDEHGNVDTSVIMDSDVIDAHRALAEWLEACGPENNNPARARYIEKLKAADDRDWIEIPAFLRRGNN